MLSELGRNVKALLDQGEDLDKLSGIGADLAGKIREIVATGSCAQLERLRKELPTAITALLKIPGLGPKRVLALHQELGLQTLEQLHHAAAQGKVRAVHGFGPKTEQNILQATVAQLQESPRVKRVTAAQVADALLAELAAVPGVEQAVAAGSLRRQRETVGDLDLLVSIATDAHSAVELDNRRFGISQPRRGWLEAKDVLNTRLLPALRTVLDRTMNRGARLPGPAAQAQPALYNPSIH